jgi:hypothetical protein
MWLLGREVVLKQNSDLWQNNLQTNNSKKTITTWLQIKGIIILIVSIMYELSFVNLILSFIVPISCLVHPLHRNATTALSLSTS